jgi:hypothetical protein
MQESSNFHVIGRGNVRGLISYDPKLDVPPPGATSDGGDE